jgi:DNA repair exonuclease SbcCD ATPase subunit
MMRLKTFRMRNYGPHAALDVEFGPGMNLICGPNGSGKTSILYGLRRVLTGDEPSEGKAEAAILAGSTGPATLELAVLGDGGEAVLFRDLRAAGKAYVRRPGLPDVVGATGTTTAALELLGCSKAFAEDHVFVDQKLIDAWFKKKPNDRAKEFAALLGLDTAEVAHREAGAVLTAFPVPGAVLGLDAARRELAEARAELAAAEAAAALVGAVPDDVARERNRLAETIAAFDRATRLDAEIGQAEAYAATAAGACLQAEMAAARADAAVRPLAEVLAQLEPNVPAVEAQLQQWQVYRTCEQARSAAAAQGAAALAAAKARPSAVPPSCPMPREPEVEEARRAVAAAGALLAQIQHLPEGSPCPTCGAPAGDLSQRRAALLTDLQAAQATQAALAGPIADWSDYHRRKLRRMEIRRQVREAVRLRKTLPVALPPTWAEADCRELLARIAQTRADLSAAQAAYAAAKATFAASQTEQARAAREVERLTAERAACPAFGDAAVARDELSKFDAALAARSAADRAVAVAQARADQAARAVAEAESAAAAAAVAQARALRLTAARDLLHRGAAPRRLMVEKLVELAGEINPALEIFEAPFRVEPDVDDDRLGFLARFADHRGRQPDRRLSGGQLVMLSWGFRIAFAGGVRGPGIISLDEPTAGLDAANMDRVAAALARLRDAAGPLGLQVLFVTHESRLSSLFEHKIDLNN